ncbi:MAG: DNA repair protein RadC [Bacteroidota bacterium]|nr:DNA repair protein RadC [Bacteroidota bacterium]
MTEGKRISIKEWSAEDRPREKLLTKGRRALSDAELIAILISSGTKHRSALDLAKDLLHKYDNDLDSLGKLDVKGFSKVKGIGPARAITIIAALELGRRKKESEKKASLQVTSPDIVWEYMFPYMSDLLHEEFYVLLLNRSNTIIRAEQISRGGVAGTVIDAKLIFKPALTELASGIILCHNHPSGNLQPSAADKTLTEKLVSAGKLLDITVFDHLIFTDKAFFSFASAGLL